MSAWSALAAEPSPPLVCDPLPPPMTCADPRAADLTALTAFEATWTKGKSGLVISLRIHTSGRGPNLMFCSPKAIGATLMISSESARDLRLELVPLLILAKPKTVDVELALACVDSPKAWVGVVCLHPEQAPAEARKRFAEEVPSTQPLRIRIDASMQVEGVVAKAWLVK